MTVFLVIYIFGAIGGAITAADLYAEDEKSTPDGATRWLVICFCGVFWISVLIWGACKKVLAL